jgi:hypothetical protein
MRPASAVARWLVSDQTAATSAPSTVDGCAGGPPRTGLGSILELARHRLPPLPASPLPRDQPEEISHETSRSDSSDQQLVPEGPRSTGASDGVSTFRCCVPSQWPGAAPVTCSSRSSYRRFLTSRSPELAGLYSCHQRPSGCAIMPGGCHSLGHPLDHLPRRRQRSVSRKPSSPILGAFLIMEAAVSR